MIEVHDIWKSYNTTLALRGVSFEVNSADIFGIIGPDGAGKTTLFRILSTLMLPDNGRAAIEGRDVVKEFGEIRRRIGYMPGRFSLYQDLTVRENLAFYATVFRTSVEENYDLIKDIYRYLEPFANRRAGALSGGMKQKLALCCSLIHRPSVLMLDEPTTGVDSVSREEFWEMLHNLRLQGITILVSTPYMDEASQCDKIALIQNGTILGIDAPNALIASYPNRLYAARALNNYHLLNEMKKRKDVATCYIAGAELHVVFKTSESPVLDGVTIYPITPTVEDCFIQLMR